MSKSSDMFAEAQKYLVGGVNSPVRAFNAVEGDPIFMESAEGSVLYDVDGNSYIDYIGSWGPMILGHAFPAVTGNLMNIARNGTSFGTPGELETILAKMVVNAVPSVEKVRFVNSGTEATMSAVRLARGYTKRDKFIKFDGCYHGHGDSFLIKAGSGALTLGIPGNPGVTEGTAKDTLIAKFNDIGSVKELFEANPEKISAIIIEPVVGNAGVIPPRQGFLKELRELCTSEGALLIFDEVMTGFRLAYGGAQELYGINPDLTTMGKVIGGGLPVGAYGGSSEIMDCVAPVGDIYQAGTLSGNPLAMAAGMSTLSVLSKGQPYKMLEELSSELERGIREVAEKASIPYRINRVGSMMCFFFTDGDVYDLETATKCDTKKFSRYHRIMLDNRVYLPPSQFESWFISLAHTDEDIEKTVSAHEKALGEI